MARPPQRRRQMVPVGQPQKMTGGPIHKVPCPWCGKGQDFRPHADEAMGGAGWGSQGLESGVLVDCDNCGRTSKILAVEQVTVIKLVPN